jgi:uncharacterized repeat protein (TIGR03803 family)
MLASSWAQTTLTTLHTFGGADGAFSYAPVARDRAGNLYGTTAGGGAFNAGAVYKVDTSGNETVLYSFTGGKDGGNPRSGLLLDTAHNLYGITAGGGVGLGQGVIFKLTPDGREIVLHALAVSDGLGSASGLIRDPSGNLYGTTELGGAHNQGVVFKVDVHGTYSILHSFGQLNVNDGSQPFAGVVRDAAGNLYGTTFAGGSFGAGCVFKIDASGHESVLYSFAGGSDGSYPSSTPILDLAGNLYGTTDVGGAYHLGTIFKLDTGGGETILHSFGATGDGKSPFVGLIADSQGNFYGVTDGGGAFSHGSVFKLDNSGNESILYSFTGKGDGARPEAALRLDSAGNLYGTTLDQGTYRQGTVFELTLP